MLGDLAFSRDGRTLFFVQGWLSVPGPGLEDPRLLAALDLASHTVKTLPNAGFAEIKAPQDLGDGRLLFAASQDFSMAGRSPRLYSMPIGGGAWSDLGHTSAPAGFVHAHPSPDRKKMATSWSVREGGFGADWREEVSVESLSSASTRALTSAFPRPFYGAHSPSWAPDGRHLAFVLALCPYAGCDISLFSVVLADTDATDSKLAFVAYGRSPVFFPGRPQ
jgi:Tol biopolymer transport system component